MTETNRKDEPLVLQSVSIVCQQFITTEAEMPIQRLIDSFLDTSRQYLLAGAINRSLELTKRVIARMNLNSVQIAAEVCDAAGSAQVPAMEILCQALEDITKIKMIDLLNQEDAMANTSLSKTVWRGNIQMLEWLTTNGACLTKRNDRGQTVLHQAASEGKVAVVEWLVSHGLSIADKDGDGFTPLLRAARNGRLEVSQWLIENGAVESERNNSGQTALHLSAGGLRENVALVKFFIDHGLLLSDKDSWGHTALHCAAVARHFDTVEFFLKNCYGDDQPGRNDLLVALFAASKADDFMFVEYLVANFELDLCHIDEHGRTALHEAAAGDALEVAKTLLNYRVVVSQPDNLGITPVIEASRYGNARVLGCLLSAEWNTENVDLVGRTALHHAAAGGHVNVMDILLYDAEVNCFDKRGWTPSHCAAASGRLAALKMLLENEARLGVETISGKTPMVLAIERGHSDVVAFLMGQSTSNTTTSIEEKPASESSTSPDNLLVDYKKYHLNPDDIHFDAPLLQDSAKGTWIGAPIEVKVKKAWQSKNFVEEVRQWSALSHPHVVKMFGFCCGDEVKDPFFVYERPTYSSLFEYLNMNRTGLWDKLYEAAMGLEYLHDRDIVHGDISCINIAVAANGLAKLKNLGSHNDENSFRQNPTWTAPELLAGAPPTYQSDVYMFGLTIVQAFKTAGDLWDIFGGVRDETIRSGKLPLKPAEMTASQWQLIQKMCSFDPNNRLSASDVVRELEIFTHESQRFDSTLEDKEILHHWANLGEYKILDAITSVKTKEVTVESILADIERIGTANGMIRDVYKRLMNIFNQLTTKTDTPHVDLVDRYTSILTAFLNRLENMNSFKLPHAAYIVRIRQAADICFSAHGHMDLVMNLIHPTNAPDWRNQWELRRREQVSEILKKLENISELFEDMESEKEREEVMTYLRFELANHASSYILATVNDFTRSKAAVAAFAASKNAEWFIPAYEVEFNALDQFNSGSFGSVHRGKWKHAQVVVKKLNLMTETNDEGNDSMFDLSCDENLSLNPSRDGLEADFLNEVKIWHKLYHPNVVQLFGACHIGNPIFVCEYAGGGQLDEYLRAHPKEILQKLYEAALGLRYLHEKQVVHKDLKCNNILIGNDGLAKLTDFGLSTLLANPVLNKEEPETELEDSGKPNVGAVRWKAPEVLEGENATLASDVYSFGMCILEAASGTFPWGKMLDAAIKHHVVKQKRIPQCPENCGEDLYELVKRMCQFDPSERIGMTEVVDVLDELRSYEDDEIKLQINIEVSK